MIASHMKDTDHAAIRAIHEQSGFDYQMPDLSHPLFIVKKVVRDEHGVVLGAGAVRVQAETFLWLDKNLPVRVRLRVVSALAHSVAEAAWRVGLDCLVAWLPPGLPPSFSRFLDSLGWCPSRADWKPWSKDL